MAEIVKIKVENEPILNAFREISDRVSDFRPLLLNVSEIMLESVKQNFDTEGERLGKPWPQLKKSTVKKRGSAHPILKVSGILYGSLTSGSDESSAWVSTNVPYAAAHQFGARIERAPRSALYIQNRYQKRPRLGQFKKGTRPGRGFSYGAYTINLPPRPFLQLNEADAETIEQAIINYINPASAGE